MVAAEEAVALRMDVKPVPVDSSTSQRAAAATETLRLSKGLGSCMRGTVAVKLASCCWWMSAPARAHPALLHACRMHEWYAGICIHLPILVPRGVASSCSACHD